ncbi:hypothetical protein KJN74_04745, partial [Candidatus Bathyarchaeota archaeon]|nr:hypothetical protein [Candidatus Bathyarchaeota archaeon]
YEPEVFSFNQRWIEGPYCPKCNKKLEEKNKGIIFKKKFWTCNLCNIIYEKPKGDLKTHVEKNFSKNY